MKLKAAKDCEYVEDPNDHLGIIYVEASRLMKQYHGLEYDEVLSELFIELSRCCQLYDKNHESKATFATYAHAFCELCRPRIVSRIKVGKKSNGQQKLYNESVTLDNAHSLACSTKSHLGDIVGADEIEFLIQDCTPIEKDFVISSLIDGESFQSIGDRHGMKATTVSNRKRYAMMKIRKREASRCS